MHMLRADAPWFEGFGEVYFSLIRRGAIKAWKRHRRMICSLAVPVGEIRVVLYDDRAESPTRNALRTVEIGAEKYSLLRIPPGIWYGFEGVGGADSGDSLIVNCASLPHDPDEIDRLPETAAEIPYRFGRRAAP